MRRIWAVAWKEFLQIKRDPLSLGMLLGIPTLMLLLYGFALNFDVRHVRLGVLDRDRTEASRALVDAFVQSARFDRVADLAPGADLEALAARRVVQAILVIPEGFAKRERRGERAPVQLLLDGTDARTAATVLAYATSLVALFAEERLARRVEEAGADPAPLLFFEPRVFYNPELSSTRFLLPGLVAFILMLTAVVSTALSVVRERERGTMERLRVSPLGPAELIAGKILPYLAVSLVAAAGILVAARILFGIEVRGRLLDLLVATVVYLLGALGWGLLVSSFSRSQATAYQLGIVTALLPSIFLSGFIFPIRSMPAVLQALTYAVPARYFLVILRGVILKGGSLIAYAQDMLFLVGFAVIVLGLAAARLVRREA